MRSARKRVVENVGVVDAGVVLTRFDPQRRSHAEVVALFEHAAAGGAALSISVVNLAEVFQHARRHTEATGLDLLAFLRAYRVTINSPDANLARRVGGLSNLEGVSLADRFAVATAEQRGARLHTTDTTLAAALRKRHLPVTRY